MSNYVYITVSKFLHILIFLHSFFSDFVISNISLSIDNTTSYKIDDKYDAAQDPNAYMDPYMRKSMALKEFKETLKSNGNYSFGGNTPLYKMRDAKISRSHYNNSFRPVSAAQA